jgi:serine/threonine-protein kinase
VHSPPPVPAEIDSTIPPALSELIIRLLAKDPALRPDTKTVKADLKAAVKQLRAAQTQIGMMPGMGGMGMTGTVVREGGVRPVTEREPAVRVDPRLEAAAIEADHAAETAAHAVTTQPGGGGALARNWPWLAGGLALAWLLAVAVYVLLTPSPQQRTDAMPISPPAPQAPLPPPEPENAPDVTGEPGAEAPPPKGAVVKADPPKVDAPPKADPSRSDAPPNKPKRRK